MEWSNLNEQMIEQFFQNSNSPTNNADVSLNFTRTSRQSHSNVKPHIENQPKFIEENINSTNPEKDFVSFANKEIQKFDQWFNLISIQQQKVNKQKIPSSQQANQEYLQQLFQSQNQSSNLQNSQSLQNSIFQTLSVLQANILCQNQKICTKCQAYQNKLYTLQMYTKNIEIQLKAKDQELKCFNQIEINQLGQQMAFQVENRLFKQQIYDLKCKNQQLTEIIQIKNKDLIKLNEEIQKFNLERSTFYFKNRTLENKVLEMQKSKSLMLSATKNSTSHSQFNITNSNNNNSTMFKSQQQTNIDNTLIHTNQFSTQKSTPEEYIQWFQKLKQIFLEKYKRQEKQYLAKFHPQLKSNQNSLKQIVNNFKKGHARYEIARSCKNIADYIKKNKENFVEMIANEALTGFKIGMEMTYGKQSNKNIEEIQQELRKSQKIAKGLQSQISHLNNQLATFKKTLVKEKQEKSNLLRTCNQLKEQVKQLQGQLELVHKQLYENDNKTSMLFEDSMKQKMIAFQQELAIKAQQLNFKSQELKKAIHKIKRQEEVHQKLQLAVKQTQYLLYKERKDKIKYFKQTLEPQSLTTACRIRPKSINQKNIQSIVNQFQGRIYIDKAKLSYKFDIIQNANKKSQSQIFFAAKKMVLNCIYEPKSSLFLSMGSSDSEFKEFMRNQKGLFWISLSQIFKLRQTQKRFLQINLSVSSIGMSNAQVFDALDLQNPLKKILIKREGSKISLLNSISIQLQTQQQAKSILTQVFKNQKQNDTNTITILELTITDKRSKQRYTSKLMFAEINLYDTLNQQQLFGLQHVENLIKDSQALGNVLNCIHFKQKYQFEINRLTHLLSECLTENSKNMLIMNISPTEMYKQNTIASLTFGSSLKSMETKSMNNYLRYSQKTPENQSASNLKQNQSKSFIKAPTFNQDFADQKQSRSILKHRNSSSQHQISGGQTVEKKKRTISRLSIC